MSQTMMPSPQQLSAVDKGLKSININENVLKEDTNAGLPNAVSMYMRDIKNIPVLSRTEEQELGLKSLEGDKFAKEKLIYHNLRLVVSIAKYMQIPSESFEDTIQNGNLGLMRAIETFDPKLGWRFSTYATWWIRQFIRREQSTTAHLIRIPIQLADLMRKFNSWESNYISSNGHEPSKEEYLDKMNELELQKDRYLDYITSQVTCSVDQTIDEDESTELGELLPDKTIDLEAVVVNSELSRELKKAIKGACPSERDAQMVYDRYGLEDGIVRTLEEVGKKYGVTRERVRQVESRTLNRLHNNRKLWLYYR